MIKGDFCTCQKHRPSGLLGNTEVMCVHATQGDTFECPCAKDLCSVTSGVCGKVNEKPQKMFSGWEALESIQTCCIYQDLRGQFGDRW